MCIKLIVIDVIAIAAYSHLLTSTGGYVSLLGPISYTALLTIRNYKKLLVTMGSHLELYITINY